MLADLRFHQVATHLGHCYAPLNHFAEPPYLLHHSTACGYLEPPLGSPTSCRASSRLTDQGTLSSSRQVPALSRLSDHSDKALAHRTCHRRVAVSSTTGHHHPTSLLLFSLLRGTASSSQPSLVGIHRRGLWSVSDYAWRCGHGAPWSIASMHLVHGRRATHVPLTHGARLWWTRSTPIPR